jgi:hypothetical protein
MVGLAEFVMRGRLQALLVVIGGSVIPLFSWVSAAVLALVTLRKGTLQGAWLLFWALLPVVAIGLGSGNWGLLTLLAGTMFMAVLLRSAVNMPLAIAASVIVGMATSGLTLAFMGEAYLAELQKAMQQVFASMQSPLATTGEDVTATLLAGMLGAGTASMAVGSLLLARYWQAALYNPGGFGQEFKALCFPVWMSTVLVLAGLGLASTGPEYLTWAMICFIPLNVAGLSLVHAWTERRGRGTGWLVFFYIAWLLLEPLKLLVMFFAIADSWIRFRHRWADADGKVLGASGYKKESPETPEGIEKSEEGLQEKTDEQEKKDEKDEKDQQDL